MKKLILLLTAFGLCSLAQSQSWNLTGNAGTNSKINFIGTTDDSPLLFRIKNTFAGGIDSVFAQTFLGFGAGHVTSGTNNTAFGYKALFSNTTGDYNTANGSNALYSNTTGYLNTANGYQALLSNTTGSYNTANGYGALTYNTTGSYNTASGSYALYDNTTGAQNVASGSYALNKNTTGWYNAAAGYYSLYSNTTGLANTATGYRSLSQNTTGRSNTAHGYYALGNNTTSSYNTAVGTHALLTTTNSQYNTAIGFNAGGSYDLGWNNTFLGANCNANGPGLYNCIAIGQDVVNTASSQARIGNAATSSIGGYANWTNISDGRYKKDINQNVKGLDFILRLQPVTYHLNVSGLNKKLSGSRDKETDEFTQKAIQEKEKILFSGFVAQDVLRAAEEANYDFSGVDKPKNENDLYGLRYAEFVVPLVKAVQELSSQNTQLKSQIEELKKINVSQKSLNDDLLKRIEKLESFFVTKN